MARALDLLRPRTPVVVDPVMVAESGGRLLDAGAEGALRELILPRATVVTPNVPEARVLAGLGEDAAPEDLVRAIHALGPAGGRPHGRASRRGHRSAVRRRAASTAIPGVRHPDGAAHGSGCTHASTLAAQLSLGRSPLEAARIAREVAGDAVRDGLRGIGAGAGPVNVLGLSAPR